MVSMTGSDAGWFRMDRPSNQADIVVLLTFDGPLDAAAVRALVEQRLLRLERFRQRPAPSWIGLPGWEPDPDFSLERHLVRAEVQPGGLPALVGEVTTRPLDPAHPLWRIVVVEGEREGALVVKVQHAIGDGFALVAAFLSLADEAAGGEVPHPAGAPAPPRWPGLLPALARAPAYALGLARLAALGWDPPGVAAVAPSGVRRVAWSAGLPLDAIRAGARRRGGTANDLLVTAVAGGLRSVLAAAGHPVDQRYRAFVPVNLRRGRPDLEAGDPLGNDFGLVFVDLPLELPAPFARFEVVRRSVAALRRSVDPLLTSQVLALCGYLPDAVHHALTGFFARKASAVLTNVPGPRTPIRLAGRTVTTAMFWVPHPATLSLGVSILTYVGEVRVGVRADVALLPEPAELVARIEEEVAELTA
jgi:diacylglycerol O-acyltransferase